jgi:hypothetical protein
MVDEVAHRFKREILLFFDLSGTVSIREICLVDIKEYFHIIGA